jgi:hypothetical protein
MPKTRVLAAVKPIRERMGVCGIAEQGSDAGLAMVQAVVRSFEVSREAAVVRLKILNLLGSVPAQRSLFP